MTTDNHPITPPPELVEQWECEYHHMTYGPDLSMFISEKAARWGADMELEACCEWLDQNTGRWDLLAEIRAARRPKTPSLKEQALAELELLRGDAYNHGLGFDAPAIRRALESLPE